MFCCNVDLCIDPIVLESFVERLHCDFAESMSRSILWRKSWEAVALCRLADDSSFLPYLTALQQEPTVLAHRPKSWLSIALTHLGTTCCSKASRCNGDCVVPWDGHHLDEPVFSMEAVQYGKIPSDIHEMNNWVKGLKVGLHRQSTSTFQYSSILLPGTG